MLERPNGYGDMELDRIGFEETGGFMSAEQEGDLFGDFEDPAEMGRDGLEEDLEGFSWAEGEGYGESDFEGDEFSLGGVWKKIKKVGSALAPYAKKFAPQIASIIGGALGGPAGAAIGGKLGGFVKQLEAEDEGETEDEMNATADIPATEDQLAESVAAAAARGRPIDAQSLGAQVVIFLGGRTPLPVKAVLPGLSLAGGNIARALVQSGDPRARALVRTLPSIQRRTVATLVQKARTGKPVTPRVAARVMTKHARRTLGDPRALTAALASNVSKKRTLDRRAIARSERFY